ncbi:di-heme oxidoredictase family protein [Marinobacterium aestuariivivens]|uniref:Di-heme oxidoredictase family protein n=1 Tax=Marinobacterium aestuariivivens TaxID=1698799 RepID=A0ABW2A498_9GAMM
MGPLFNARACAGCHLHNGRGHPPASAEGNAVSLFLRLSVVPDPQQRRQMEAGILANVPDPVYGRQLQNFSVQNVPAEGRLGVEYSDEVVHLADGSEVHLRRPRYRILQPGYGPVAAGLNLSPRLAPPMIGLGLLEAVPESALLALEDTEDRNGDGISGRLNRVWSQREQRVVAGRFGWKAGNGTLADQNDSALAGDIGIGNALFPVPFGDCMPAQSDCRQAPHGNTAAQDNLEAARAVTDSILFYSRHLAPPVRPDAQQPDVQAGKAVFNRIGCSACHTPNLRTARDAEAPLAGQSIWPYSDLLLHDMGPDLADGHEEYRARGSEWRTAPLWGLGLAKALNPKSGYLHDGRARTPLEAALWHGGEAQAAKQNLMALDAKARRQLLVFLDSL